MTIFNAFHLLIRSRLITYLTAFPSYQISTLKSSYTKTFVNSTVLVLSCSSIESQMKLKEMYSRFDGNLLGNNLIDTTIGEFTSIDEKQKKREKKIYMHIEIQTNKILFSYVCFASQNSGLLYRKYFS